MNARQLALGGILVAAWLMATAMGPCAFFSPATPESPNRPAITPDYSTASMALETLAKGMADKGQTNGQEVYLGALAESSDVSVGDGRAFRALFDVQDLAEHPLSYAWTREYEPQLLQSLYEQYSSPFEMTWARYEPGGNETGGVDDSLLHRSYQVVLVLGTGNSVRRVPVAIGAADLYFVRSKRNPANWVIAVWQDIRTVPPDSALTLGTFRLETQR